MLLALSLGVASTAVADRLITIPLGRKIGFDEFTVDSFVELSNGDSLDRFVGIGITQDFELDYHGERIDDGPMRDTIDFSYNYLPPIIDQLPGISVGVEDVLNRTSEGRRYYLATTWESSADNIGSGNLPVELTLGIAQGVELKPFVGASLPLGTNANFLVEHDGYRLSTGFEFHAPKSGVAARVFVRDQEVLVGANLTLRF